MDLFNVLMIIISLSFAGLCNTGNYSSTYTVIYTHFMYTMYIDRCIQ